MTPSDAARWLAAETALNDAEEARLDAMDRGIV